MVGFWKTLIYVLRSKILTSASTFSFWLQVSIKSQIWLPLNLRLLLGNPISVLDFTSGLCSSLISEHVSVLKDPKCLSGHFILQIVYVTLFAMQFCKDVMLNTCDCINALIVYPQIMRTDWSILAICYFLWFYHSFSFTYTWTLHRPSSDGFWFTEMIIQLVSNCLTSTGVAL